MIGGAIKTIAKLARRQVRFEMRHEKMTEFLIIAKASTDTKLFKSKLGTCCGVIARNAVICIGGMATAGIVFNSVDESVRCLTNQR